MNTNQVTIFQFQANNIRVVTLEGNPWFVGQDILACLFDKAGGNAHQYSKLDSDQITEVNPLHFNLGSGKTRKLISESGLYKLIMRSDKPNAKPFQDWVTKEVLPSIRKTGSYVTGQPSLQENPNMDPLDLMMAQAELLRSSSWR